LANLWVGNLKAAQEAAEKYMRQEPDDPYSYVMLATAYGFQGRQVDAANVISDLRERFPVFGVKEIILSQRYKAQDKLTLVTDMLCRAGLPG
jgi:hypothetical protein